MEIKVYKQKVKHLLYEHQNQVTELKSDGWFLSVFVYCLERTWEEGGGVKTR